MFLPVAEKAAFGNRIYYLAQDLIAWPFGKRDFVIITGKSEKSRIITEGKNLYFLRYVKVWLQEKKYE